MNIDSNTSADPSMSQSTSPPRSSSAPRPSLGRETSRPKGILKNAAADGLVSPSVEMDVQAGTQAEGVKWDEVNLSLNDVNRDSTMKITEPKTPYVRYNAETDEVMDLDKIPGFELGISERGQASGSNSHDGQDSPRPTSAASGSASHRSNASASSRSSSFSGSRRGSESSRRNSESGERKMVVVEAQGPAPDAEDEGDDEATREAKKLFKSRRNSHYGGEGEVMKRFRAQVAPADDEDTDDEEAKLAAAQAAENASRNAVCDDDDDEFEEDYTSSTIENTGLNGRSNSASLHPAPPVPPLLNGYSH